MNIAHLFKEISAKIISKIKYFYSYLKSWLLGRIRSKQFSQVHTFLMFIGYPRSGHSLIASLLDAHPNIIIGMEWGVLPHLKMGYDQEQIFYSILNNSKTFNLRKRNVWTGYSYHIDGMFQGKYTELLIIGDKMGGRTSMMVKESPELLEQLKSGIKKSIKFIHVIRNPFDVITTMTKRSQERKSKNEDLKTIHLLPFIKSFFDRAETISWLKLNIQAEIFDLYQEDFIKNPDENLIDLLKFVNIESDVDYVKRCSEIVYDQPHKSRFDIDWTIDLVHYVQEEIKKYNFLSRYSYDD